VNPNRFQSNLGTNNFLSNNFSRVDKGRATLKMTTGELNALREKLNMIEPKVESGIIFINIRVF
jgi:hypothetical protein